MAPRREGTALLARWWEIFGVEAVKARARSFAGRNTSATPKS